MEPTTLRKYVRDLHKYCARLLRNGNYDTIQFDLVFFCSNLTAFCCKSYTQRQLLAGAQIPIYETNIDFSGTIQCEIINFYGMFATRK